MTSVAAATTLLLSHTKDYGTVHVPLQEAVGRVLAEQITADRDFPPFDRAARDGIAFRFEDLANGQKRFPVVGLQAAGSPPFEAVPAGSCIEIMTGAVVPAEVDTVLMYENVSIEAGIATIQVSDVQLGNDIHQQASDYPKGTTLLTENTLISTATINTLATIGCTKPVVKALPKVALFSTGDELVPIKENPAPHQIRQSNGHAIASILQRHHIQPKRIHVNDDKSAIQQILLETLADFDVLILTGGVSKGKLDYLPEIFEALEVEQKFHRVAQRPGKPFWFGCSQAAQPIFAFPGNPVSAFICTYRYFLPWLRASLGLPPFENRRAILTTPITFPPNLQRFLQVTTTFDEHGQVHATPIRENGSGDLVSLALADGFLELPAEKTVFKAGEVFNYMAY